MRLNNATRRLATLLCVILAASTLKIEASFAAPLTQLAANLTNTEALATSAYALSFKTSSSSAIKQVNLRFSTAQGGAIRPENLNLTSATLSATSGLGAGWSLSTASASSGVLILTRDSTDTINADTEALITLGAITNSAIGDCDSSEAGLQDTCHIRITTYSDDGSTAVDDGSLTYSVYEDPFFNFEIKGVSSSTTVSGITTNRPSSGKELALNHLNPEETVYITQEITVETNAPNGYKIYAYLDSALSGTNPSNSFDPFAGINATWTSPQEWETPPGTEANSHTGWIGINTSDERAGNQWTDAEGLFAPFSTAPRLIAASNTSDRNGSTIYVTYAVETNHQQPADTYNAYIRYDVQTHY